MQERRPRSAFAAGFQGCFGVAAAFIVVVIGIFLLIVVLAVAATECGGDEGSLNVPGQYTIELIAGS